jgi:hypothetical protein
MPRIFEHFRGFLVWAPEFYGARGDRRGRKGDFRGLGEKKAGVADFSA